MEDGVGDNIPTQALKNSIQKPERNEKLEICAGESFEESILKT